jgi:hypothetical protein
MCYLQLVLTFPAERSCTAADTSCWYYVRLILPELRRAECGKVLLRKSIWSVKGSFYYKSIRPLTFVSIEVEYAWVDILPRCTFLCHLHYFYTKRYFDKIYADRFVLSETRTFGCKSQLSTSTPTCCAYWDVQNVTKCLLRIRIMT